MDPDADPAPEVALSPQIPEPTAPLPVIQSYLLTKPQAFGRKNKYSAER